MSLEYYQMIPLLKIDKNSSATPNASHSIGSESMKSQDSTLSSSNTLGLTGR